MASIQADVPVPSVEVDDDSNLNPGRHRSDVPRTLTLHRVSSSTSSSASITVQTPSTSAGDDLHAGHGTHQAAASRDDREPSSLDGYMAQLRLSSSSALDDSGGIAGAIDSLHPEETRPPPRSRRSGSHVDRAPHQVSQEERPEDNFHAAGFQNALREAQAIMANMAAALGSSDLHLDPRSTMHELQQEAMGLAHFQCPRTRKIAFVGDSGAGKSSLINSLLDLHGLARTSNNGSACTCAVTEYRYHQDERLAVQVHLFGEDEIRTQLENLLNSYRLFHLHGEQLETHERGDAQEQATLAIHTFRAMFREKLQNEDLLLENTAHSVLEDLVRWAQESSPAPDSVSRAGLDLAGCSDHLVLLSSELPFQNRPAMWPYIKHIQVFSNAYILSRGLILIDLPGLRDLNLARLAITERYLYSCDGAFVVCTMGRATTSQSVEDVLELARRTNTSNYAIICTKSDDVLADEVVRDEEQQAARIRNLERDIRNHERELDQVTEEIYDEELNEGDWQLLRRLRGVQRMHQREIDTNSFRLKKLLMTTCNTRVTADIRQTFGAQLPAARELPIFCVSNKDYWEWRGKPAEVARPYLGLSGIIEARRYCISLVSDHQHRAATNYMQNQIPGLLSRVGIWAGRGDRNADDESTEEIRTVLENVENRLATTLGQGSAVSQLATTVRGAFYITDPVEIRRLSRKWSREAVAISASWARLPAQTYKAFCRMYGEHKTGFTEWKVRNWNEEVIQDMATDLEDPWLAVVEEMNQHQSTVGDLMESAVEDCCSLLTGANDCRTLETLASALVARIRVLNVAIEEYFDELDSELEVLRIRALTGVRSSLIVHALIPTYQSCTDEYGSGSHCRRINIMEEGLSNRTLFTGLLREFMSVFQAKIDEAQRRMQDSTAAHLRAVRADLDMARSEYVARESAQDQPFRLRVARELEDCMARMETIRAMINS